MAHIEPPIDVSVIIPVFNDESGLPVAVKSALNQAGVSLEIIVIDDASKIAMQPVVAQIAPGDARVKCVRLPDNRGPAGARNAALDIAAGEFIAVLDSDDAFLPGRLEAMVRAARDLSADIIVDNLVLKEDGTPDDASGRLLVDSSAVSFPHEINLPIYLDPSHPISRDMGYLKPLFRRATLAAHDARYDERLRNSEDFFFVAELLARGASMYFCDLAGYVYTIRDGSISQRISTQQAKAILDKAYEFQFKYANLMTGETGRVAALRLRMLTAQYVNETVVQALKRKNLSQVGIVVRQNPNLLTTVIKKLSGILLRKLVRQKEARFKG